MSLQITWFAWKVIFKIRSFLFFYRTSTKTSIFPFKLRTYSPSFLPLVLPSLLPSIPQLDKGYSWSQNTPNLSYEISISNTVLVPSSTLTFKFMVRASAIKSISFRLVEMFKIRIQKSNDKVLTKESYLLM